MRASPRPRLLVDATRQLAMLARLGYPLADGVRAMSATSPWPARFADDLEQGDSLAEAARRHPRLFTRFYVSALQAAEAAEKPETILAELSRMLEQADSLRARVRTALLYPFLALNALLLEMLLFTVTVVPDVLLPLASTALEDRGGLPPWVLSLVHSHALPFVVGMLWIAMNVAVLRQVGAGTAAYLPWAGRLQCLAAQALWSRALGCLLATGMDLPTALDRAATVLPPGNMQSFYGALGETCRRGNELSKCLSNSPLVEPLLAHAIGTAEVAEDFPRILLLAADRMSAEVERRADACVRMVGPWATAAVGVLVLLGLSLFWGPYCALLNVVQ